MGTNNTWTGTNTFNNTITGSITGNAATATTATTANALNTSNSYSGVNFTASGTVFSSATGGFSSSTYAAGARNPIWYFGNASTYGISYFQGTAGIGSSDTIGIHPNGTATAAGSAFAVTGAGNAYAIGNITAYYSDERLKTKIRSIENALDKVCEIETMIYHANQAAVDLGYDASIIEVGVTAQSVQKVQPEAVAPAPIDNQYLTVRYERLTPLIIESIKELRAEIEILKAKL